MSLRVRVLTSNNVLLPDSERPTPATIVVDAEAGTIAEIKRERSKRSDFPGVHDQAWVDAGDLWIVPGLVDAHVHLNEPGRTDWEGFYTGTRAAASGGVTCVVDMPLNSIPPTTTCANLAQKRKAASGQCWVDVAFWGGLVPGNASDLMNMVQDGAKGFKGFLIESGVEEFPCVSEEDVGDAMDVLQNTDTVLLFHAELDDGHDHASKSSDESHYSTFLASRPPTLETSAIDLIISLQAKHRSSTLRSHIVHLSAASALPSIRAARASGAKLTIETCFHYLVMASSTIPDGAPQYKCCPPIRDEKNRDELWEALKDGTIDCVVSDHSPCTAELKLLESGNIMDAWGGISTLGLGLSLLWTEAKKRGVGARDVFRWVCEATAVHAGLEKRKGAIKVGMDADLVIWDPEKAFKVTKESLVFKNKLSPYEGMSLTGKVERTYVRGQLVWDAAGDGQKLQPIGCLL